VPPVVLTPEAKAAMALALVKQIAAAQQSGLAELMAALTAPEVPPQVQSARDALAELHLPTDVTPDAEAVKTSFLRSGLFSESAPSAGPDLKSTLSVLAVALKSWLDAATSAEAETPPTVVEAPTSSQKTPADAPNGGPSAPSKPASAVTPQAAAPAQRQAPLNDAAPHVRAADTPSPPRQTTSIQRALSTDTQPRSIEITDIPARPPQTESAPLAATPTGVRTPLPQTQTASSLSSSATLQSRAGMPVPGVGALNQAPVSNTAAAPPSPRAENASSRFPSNLSMPGSQANQTSTNDFVARPPAPGPTPQPATDTPFRTGPTALNALTTVETFEAAPVNESPPFSPQTESLATPPRVLSNLSVTVPSKNASTEDTEQLPLVTVRMTIAAPLLASSGQASGALPRAIPVEALLRVMASGLLDAETAAQPPPPNATTARPLNVYATTDTRSGDDSEPVRAADSQSLPPPFRGGPLTAQAAKSPTLTDHADPVLTASKLLNATAGAFARQTLLQIASLPDSPQPGVRAPNALWMFEIPLMTPQGSAVAQCEIERDGTHLSSEVPGPIWRMRLAINVEPLGPVRASLALSGDRAWIALGADRPESLEKMRAGVSRLDEALRQESLQAEIAFQPGPSATPAGRRAGFVDRAS
jgi:hypothetical protein